MVALIVIIVIRWQSEKASSTTVSKIALSTLLYFYINFYIDSLSLLYFASLVFITS